MTWQQIDIAPGVGTALESLLRVVKTIAQVNATALDAVLSVLTPLTKVLGSSGDSLDLSLLTDLSTEMVTVHLYPAQEFQAMKFPQWTNVLEKSFEFSDLSCVSSPTTLLVFLATSGTAQEVIDEAQALSALFGQAPPVTTDKDKPRLLDRSQLRMRPGSCKSIFDNVPFLEQLNSILQSQASTSTPNALGVLQETLVLKLSLIQERLAAVDSFLELLASFNLPGIWVFSGTVTTVAEISLILSEASTKPDVNDYVAGTGILIDPPASLLLQGLLT